MRNIMIVFIIGIAEILICFRIINVYSACFLLAELVLLAFVLKIASKKSDERIINTVKPCGSRKLIFIERLDKKESALEYLYAEDQEIKKILEKNMFVIGDIKEGKYATLVEFEDGREIVFNDVAWAVLENDLAL